MIIIDKIQYLRKKYNSKIRSTRGRIDKLGNPIEFRLTFDEWSKLWNDSGQLPNRDYMLSRVDDIGHYVIGNVFVNHTLHNVMEAMSAYTNFDRQITQYAIETGYSRRTVKSMIRRGDLEL